MDTTNNTNDFSQHRTQQDLISMATGGALIVTGLQRRSWTGLCVAAMGLPIFYRGVTGRWPEPFSSLIVPNDTREALGGNRGIHVREAIRLERPVEEVFAYWRRLENLPRV